MTNQLLEHLLRDIGLTTNETRVYLALTVHGSLTYNKTAELSGINRTTCYAVTKRLIEYGLVTEDLGSSVVHLIAKPINALEDKLAKEQASVIKRLELVKRAGTEFQKITSTNNYIEPKIRHVEEADIKEHLYKRADVWDRSMNQYDKTMWGFQDSLFENRFQNFIVWYWTRPLSENMKLKMFSDDPTYSKDFINPSPSRILRYWPNVISFSASTWVYGDYVVLLSIQERPNYLLEIYEPLLASNMRQFFKVMWETTETEPQVSR